VNLTKPTVSVGGIRVADTGPLDILQDIERVMASRGLPRSYLAVHIGGLNCADRPDFVQAMNSGYLTYADGISAVVLAKLAGARRVKRTSTTDFGLPMLDAASTALGRRAIVAIIGGPPGLAERAAEQIERCCSVTVALSAHGFYDDYRDLLREIRTAKADVLIVGMGMPKEALWVQRHMDQITARVVLTCGGWLGFLAGDEMRAPRIIQRAGLEWAWRLVQAPTRLIERYARGAITFLLLAVRILWIRLNERQ